MGRKPIIKHHIWLHFVFLLQYVFVITLCLYLHQAKHTYDMCNLLCMIMTVKRHNPQGNML